MQCPGQDNRYWDGDAVFEIPCPHCGNILEFFKDDSQRSCSTCGRRVLNPRIDFGCAAYCSHAEQCLGAMPAELLAAQKNLFRDRLTLAVRKHLADREGLFKRAERRTELAEHLCKAEQRGDMAAILAATLLLDCDDPATLLGALKVEDDLQQMIMRLIRQQPPEADEDQASSAIFHDACLLERQEGDTQATSTPVFKTPSAATLRGDR